MPGLAGPVPQADNSKRRRAVAAKPPRVHPVGDNSKKRAAGQTRGRRERAAGMPRRYWKRMRRRATTIRAATAIAARMPRRLFVMTRFDANTRSVAATQAFFVPSAAAVAGEGTDG